MRLSRGLLVQAFGTRRLSLGVPVAPQLAHVMTSYAVGVMITAVSLLAASVRVQRYARAHVTAQATVGGRGLYVSKTPDGVWWAVRIRRRVCTPTSPWLAWLLHRSPSLMPIPGTSSLEHLRENVGAAACWPTTTWRSWTPGSVGMPDGAAVLARRRACQPWRFASPGRAEP